MMREIRRVRQDVARIDNSEVPHTVQIGILLVLDDLVNIATMLDERLEALEK